MTAHDVHEIINLLTTITIFVGALLVVALLK